MRIREIRAVGLFGATPEGGWTEELWPEASSDETSRSRQFVIGTDSAASEPDPDEDERETLDESDN